MDVANLGVIGFTVVLAEMNTTAPAIINANPVINNINATHSLPGICTPAHGLIRATNQIASANKATRATGGILSSRRNM